MVHIFLANGFEEIEALTTLDILRRSGLEVQTVSLVGPRLIYGVHGIPVMADEKFQKNKIMLDSEGLILPGGMPGAKNLMAHDGLRKALVAHNEKGSLIAAICAAPMILGEYGLLEGKRATCYPGFEHYLKGAEYTGAPVVADGNIITGKGPGASVEFAFSIVQYFTSLEKVQTLRHEMCYECKY